MIKEVNFKLESRIESRNDIDMIVKDFDAVTICILEKEIILRLTNDSIRAVGMRRSRGVTFETVRGVMARLSLFDGVDATLYSASKHIGPAHDSLDSGAELPSFAVALTRDEIDQRFDERRRRRDERESGKFSTPTKGRTSTPLSSSKSLKSPIQRNAEASGSNARQLNDRSDVILKKISQMAIDDEEDPQDDSDSDDVESDKIKDLVVEINCNTEAVYVFVRSDIIKIEVIDFPEATAVNRCYRMKENKQKTSVTFTRIKGSVQVLSYYRIVLKSSTRVLIENTFGLLKSRFRQLLQLDIHSVDKITKFIVSSCVLHNLCIDMDDHIEIRDEENEELFNEPEVMVFETELFLKKNGE